MHTTQGRTCVCLGRTEKGAVMRKHQYIPIEGNLACFPGLDCELNSGPLCCAFIHRVAFEEGSGVEQGVAGPRGTGRQWTEPLIYLWQGEDVNRS